MDGLDAKILPVFWLLEGESMPTLATTCDLTYFNVMNDTTTTMTSSDSRDARGQFKLGHTGMGGRPVGARSKLTTQFLDDLRETWATHGKTALERCAVEEPAQFVRVVAGLLPRQLEADVSLFADAASFAEAFELAVATIGGDADAAMKRLRKSNPRLIEATLIDE